MTLLWFPPFSGDTLDYFFVEKKLVLDWGTSSVDRGGKRDENG
jgi:hypothetical protein